MIEQTIEKLKRMSLGTFARSLREQMESPQHVALSFDERLGFLVDQEFLAREDRRLKRNLREATLKQKSSLEDVDFDTSRNLKRQQLLELAECRWIKLHHNLIITGPTGVGKSFISCALAEKACRSQLRAKYAKASDLARELLIAREDGSYPKLRTKLSRTHLLIIDEWLRDPLPQEQARELLDLIDDRFRVSSTLFASQLPVKEWHQHISDPTLADAILDRVVHDSHRIQLTGDSMRKATASITTQQAETKQEQASLCSDH